MTVHLRSRLPSDPPCAAWVQIGTRVDGTTGGNEPGLAAQLEEAFDEIGATWWDLGRRLGADPTAILAHMPACVPNASDFGLMLAWSRLVEKWAARNSDLLVVCADPWLFRHLATLPGIEAGPPPPLVARRIALTFRGIAARLSASLRFAAGAMRLRKMRKPGTGGRFILVYGHPASNEAGYDAYFGDLMAQAPGLRRALHVDCPPARAESLSGGGRSCSLHGWGSAFHALTHLPFARWRPASSGAQQWLIRRAAALEGSSAQSAAIAWQIHCQSRWLAKTRPRLVLWPWENHAWERAFIRTARRNGTRLIGYQHSVVGRQMLNYSPASNADGDASLPDRILCSGESTRAQLLEWGIPADRLSVAGALRGFGVPDMVFDPGAPVFMALPFDEAVAREMLDAARSAVEQGFRFLIRAHPMFPLEFEESESLARANGPLGTEPVSRVIYAASTVGLEALLAGVPVLRFRPLGRIAIDILPAGVTAQATSAQTLAVDLAEASPPERLEATRFFGPVRPEFWREAVQETQE